MNRSRVKSRSRGGFTIVELLVVIAIIGILATISIVSYGAWRRSVTSATLKSDLNGVISAMDSYRTFNNGYPGSVPSSFKPSNGVSLSGGSTDTKTYCVEATSSDDASLVFYVASEVKDKGPQAGNCASRPTLPAPSVPSNLAITSAIGTNVGLTWSGAVADVASYNVQCASDAAYIVGVRSASPAYTETSATITGLSPSSTYYCHIRAVNATGASAWSPSVTTTTANNYGALAIATSIDGYWTSAPQGFLLEDGTAVSRTTYADLFAVIGTTYGAGDGSTTFNLPDSRGRATVNRNVSDTEFDTMGEKTGSKTEALSIAQLPSHQHTGTTGPGNSMSFRIVYVAGGNLASTHVTGYTSATSYADYNDTGYPGEAHTHSFTTDATGSGATHNNIQPSIVKLSAIKFVPVDKTAVTQPTGTSIQGYWTSAPSGYLLEDGSAISRATYSVLFGIIGTTYGAGDGSTTFNLPDSRGRVAVNKSTDTEFDTMGEKVGVKSYALTIADLPAHTHTGTTGNGNSMSYRLVYGAGSGHANNHLTGWTPGSYTDAVNANYPGENHTHSFTTDATGSGVAHNEIQPSIVKLSAIKYITTAGVGSDVASGTSLQGYWTSAPSGYLLEDGSAVSRATYSVLFGVIGTTYGTGDGSTTFNLPDSRGRVAVNKSTDTEFDTMGEKPGSKTEALSIAQIPAHTHTGTTGSGNAAFYRVVSTAGTTTNLNAVTGYDGTPGFADYVDANYPGAAHTHSFTTNPIGGGGAHINIQPSIVKLFAIKY